MKIVRYQSADGIHYGVESEGRIERITGDPFQAIERTGQMDYLYDVRLLCPVERPRIFGVAYNYRQHTDESGKEQPTLPVLFMSVVNPAWAPLVAFSVLIVILLRKPVI